MSDDIGEKLFVPEILLPSQYRDRGMAAETPEQKIALAMIQDAVDCALKEITYCECNNGNHPRGCPGKHANRQLRMKVEAKAWFSGEYYSMVTFEDCCAQLGLDPEWMRRGLKRVPEGSKMPRMGPFHRSPNPTSWREDRGHGR